MFGFKWEYLSPSPGLRSNSTASLASEVHKHGLAVCGCTADAYNTHAGLQRYMTVISTRERKPQGNALNANERKIYQ